MSRHLMGGSRDGKECNTPSKGKALEVKKRKVGCFKETEEIISRDTDGHRDCHTERSK